MVFGPRRLLAWLPILEGAVAAEGKNNGAYLLWWKHHGGNGY